VDLLRRDLVLAARLLWKDRSFAATAILTLAVCIGANAAMFTIVHAVLLKPLPVPGADDILVMGNRYPHAGAVESANSGVPDYFDRLTAVTAFEEQAMFNFQGGGTLDLNGTPQRVPGIAATPSLFRLLRVPPILGRIFTEAEGEVGQNQQVILGYGLWQQAYGGDPHVVGRLLRLNGRPYTIVGVMPRGFLFVDPGVQVWTPLAFTSEERSDNARHNNSWVNVGRLKPGATLAQAQAQVNALNAGNLERFPRFKELLLNAGFHTRVERLQDLLVRRIKGTLFLLWGGAGFVLLIGAVNLANLVLARATLRRKDLVTRLALGASRKQLARYVTIESVLLAVVGGLSGLAVGAAVMRGLARIGFEKIPRASEVQMDPTVYLFSMGIAVIVGLLLALLPIADLGRVNVADVLQEESRGGTAGKARRAVQRMMVVVQVAFALVLLIGAGLLLTSFRHVLTIDPGFKGDGVLTSSIVMPPPRYRGDAEVRQFMNRALEGLRAIPGVSGAGATTLIPLGGNHSDGVILAEGYVMKPGESLVSPMHVRVTPGYFEAIGATLRRGRSFAESDREDTLKVVIVDEALARKFWPTDDPIGRRMYRPSSPDDMLKVDEHTQWLTVVGVVGNINVDDVTGNTTVGAYYIPFAQAVTPFATFAVKSQLERSTLVGGVRAAVAAVDPELALFDIRTMAELTDASLMSRRAAMVLALAFAGMALFLAGVGLYGVLAYLVTQRTREIGIRLALGSTAGGIFELVLREGLLLVATGLAVGLSGVVLLRSALESQVYGARPFDPWVVGAVLFTLTAVALAATTLPAYRAARLDPVRVLSA
jgi:predicted permease